ncbi:MAG: acylphosphatase [Elusimicrobiota bacterium]
MTIRLHLLIKGRVQGVGYRWFARDTAGQMALSGWVRNLVSGDVEAEVEGDPGTLRKFIGELKTGLPFARVSAIQEREVPAKGDKEPFDIY